METKYTQVYKDILKSTDDTITNNNSEKYIDDFKAIVHNKMQSYHVKLEKKKNELIELAFQAHINELQKVNSDDNKNRTELTFNDKIKNLIGMVDGIISKTEVLESTMNLFKEQKLNQLIELKNDDFNILCMSKLKFKAFGRTKYDIVWAEVQNKSKNSSIDINDSNKLIINANECYNYYVLNKILIEESLLIEFDSTVSQASGYLYFGIMNENNLVNSNCMCSNIKNCFYLRSNGYVYIGGNSTYYAQLKFHDLSKAKVAIKVILSEKRIWFSVNDCEEVGPFTIEGSLFTVTSGTCNSASGYIRISNSVIIG